MEEKIKRYSRLGKDADLKKTLDEFEEEYLLNGSVFLACNCPNPTEYLFAKEGIRTLLLRLRGLEDEAQRLIEEPQQGEIDE